jgi:hypothetical protein
VLRARRPTGACEGGARALPSGALEVREEVRLFGRRATFASHVWNSTQSAAPAPWPVATLAGFEGPPSVEASGGRAWPAVSWRAAGEGDAPGDAVAIEATWALGGVGGSPGAVAHWTTYVPPALAGRVPALDLGPGPPEGVWAGARLASVAVTAFDVVDVDGYEAFLSGPAAERGDENEWFATTSAVGFEGADGGRGGDETDAAGSRCGARPAPATGGDDETSGGGVRGPGGGVPANGADDVDAGDGGEGPNG